MTRILVVDDDQEITKLLEKFLSNEGYQVAVASNGSGALAAASANEPELVLLDIVLGSEDGREVLRELRLISDVPVIFLTGRGLETERIAGLKLGADDYIVKPFSLGEVSARIETVLRRSGVNTRQHQIEAPDISYGDLQINENTHEVRLAGSCSTSPQRSSPSSRSSPRRPARSTPAPSCSNTSGPRPVSGRTRRRSPSTFGACARRLRPTPTTRNGSRPFEASATASNLKSTRGLTPRQQVVDLVNESARSKWLAQKRCRAGRQPADDRVVCGARGEKHSQRRS